ncbi:MAG: adenylate/guanylate cyclase domain-containing protein [Treponema sp.]|jgi:class 3 adenylate cyclase/CHASE2 domain-containing sensor protein|nr:adenylate/guanylate cyclase domain-containing protein [Treponema sp.]
MGTDKKIKLGKPLVAVIIAALVFIVISGLHLLGVFHFLEYKSYDMRVRFWAERNWFTVDLTGGYIPASYEILAVVLDDESVNWAQQERGWGWPWPRQAYSEIIDFLNDAGANSVAFDILYTEPSVYRNAKQDEIIDNAIIALEELERERETRGPAGSARSPESREAGSGRNALVREALRSLSARQDDTTFIESSEKFGRVVQAVMFSTQSGTSTTWPSEYDLPLFQPENFGSYLEKFSIGENEKGQFPIPGLIESAGALGSVTGIPDSDGVYRRLRPFTLFDGKAVPGLSTASLIVSGYEPQIFYDEKSKSIQWEHINIPVDKNGFTLLRFRGDIEEKYKPIRASAVLRNAEALKNLEEFSEEEQQSLLEFRDYFRDTFVFVGVYGQGFFDIFPTPISSMYPGVGAHITMLDNCLQGDFIHESSEWFNLLILIIVVAAIVFLAMFSPRISVSLIGLSVVVTGIVIIAFTSYQFGNLWVPMVTYLAGTLASFLTVTLYNYATEGSQKRFIKSAFSQYLSPKVIDQIMLDPSQLKLGGEKREMTAIFTDLRAFSTFSEALGDPAKLVELLNFYLTKMCDIILENQGTIDKYVGDAIIGFWGAPVHMENHALLACRSAVYMKKLEKELNIEALANGILTPKVLEALDAKGKLGYVDGEPRPLYTRLGLNTGDMVVGNMGTPNKMNYTIMGNAVNLAARLEGVNDQYETGGIMISEYTRTHIGDEFVLRPLSRVRVVGINTPLRLYELLDIASEAAPELLEMVKNWEKAFDLYEKQEFATARDMFESISLKNPSDLAAKMYFNRCVKYISAPPDEKAWDNGVDNLTQK